MNYIYNKYYNIFCYNNKYVKPYLPHSYSIAETYTSCLENHADLKELIPEFYDTEKDANEWLENRKRLPLGTTQRGKRVRIFAFFYSILII